MAYSGTIRSMFIIAVAAITFLAFFSQGVRAESVQVEDLSTAIKNSILLDPRTLSLPQADIDSLVIVLTREAQKNGLTARDIVRQAQSAEDGMVDGVDAHVATTCSSPFLCQFSEALGFAGADITIPIMLGATSMLLIWLCAEMLHRRSRLIQSQSSNPAST